MTQMFATQCECQTAEEKPAEFPFLVEFFMVIGGGYRGMAYRDNNGRWHSARTGDELRGQVYVLE